MCARLTTRHVSCNGSLQTKTAYVYGWDEQPVSCEPKIRAMFGAVKKKWPHVATVAVLNWEGGLPPDLPVDIWVLQYEEYNATNAAAWIKAGKKQFWYAWPRCGWQRTGVYPRGALSTDGVLPIRSGTTA